MMRSLALLAALACGPALSGCVDAWNAPYQAVKAEGVKAIQTFDDNALAAGIEALCAVPYGAVVRNAQKLPNVPIIFPAACGALSAPPVAATPAQIATPALSAIAAPVPIAAPPVPVASSPATP